MSGLTFLLFLPGCTVIILSSSEKTMLSTIITMQFSFFFLLMFQESLFEAGIGRQVTSHPFLISKPSSEFQLSTLFALFRWINVTNTACRVSDEEYQTKFGSRSQHKSTHELTLLTTEKSIRITSYLGSPLQRYWKEHTDNLIFDHRSFYCHI